MDEKETLNQIKNLIEDYEQKRFIVMPIYKIRAILDGEKYVKIVK